MDEETATTPNQDNVTIVAGVYVVKRKLGQGGMAAVYLADCDQVRFDYSSLYAYTQVQGNSHLERRRKAEELAAKLRGQDLDPGTVRALLTAQGIPVPGAQVALKVAIGEADVARFETEWKSLLCLNHPNVVQVYGGGVHLGRPYYAMELLERIVSATRVKEKFTVAQKLQVVVQAARGLGYLHANGIVHRDVKPDNAVVCEALPGEFVTKVTDLGIAKQLEMDGTTLPQTAMGTPHYMSPEQFASTKHVDHRADIYSLGATFYELVAGIKPYHDKTTVFELLQAITLHTLPVPVKQHKPNLPDAVVGIIECAMAWDADCRYQKMDELVKDIEKYQADEDVAVTRAVGFNADSGVKSTARVGEGKYAFERYHRKAALRAGMPRPSSAAVATGAARPAVAAVAAEPEKPLSTLLIRLGLALAAVALVIGLGIAYYASRPAPRHPAPATIAAQRAPLPAAANREAGPTAKPAPSPTVTATVLPPGRVPGLEKTLTVDLGGGVTMEFVLIPPGTFLMGSESGREDEKPVHTVTLTKPFYLGKYEVTQEQWQVVIGTNPSWTRGPKLPVTDVCWDDFQVFIGRLNEKSRAAGAARTGSGTEPVPPSSEFRLPTEAEWEYACRAGSTTAYGFGDSEASLGEYAWYDVNSGGTHPVGQKKPNSWGLYDMHGNVWEWCQDWYGDYAADAAIDPTGAATVSFRVFRGGSWSGPGGSCRSAFRQRRSPVDRGNNLGCRLALVPAVSTPSQATDGKPAGNAKLQSPSPRPMEANSPLAPPAGPDVPSVERYYRYTLKNGAVTIARYAGPGGDLVVPSAIDGRPVTGIGAMAFSERAGLTSVTIPASVTRIENNAFYRCTGLRQIMIPSGIALIEGGVFSGCTGLRHVTIPDGVTEIGRGAFSGCTGLADVTIPASVTTIGDGAFNGCTGLTDITIPDGVRQIGVQAFCQCSNLTRVTIPASVVSITGNPFGSCRQLQAIVVAPASPAYTGSTDGVLFDKAQTALIACPDGKTGSYRIPDSVTSIRASAFMHCPRVTDITIPNGVTSIGDSAFFGSGVTRVTIPASVTSIGVNSFTDCWRLSAISVDAANPAYCATPDGVLFSKAKTILVSYPDGRVGSYEIPEGVTNIAKWAFNRRNRLTTVTIPSSVTMIEEAAFAQCSALTGVYFKGNAPRIGSSNDRGVLYGADGATVYYLPGTTGWGEDFDGRPTAVWDVPKTRSAAPTPGAGVAVPGPEKTLAVNLGGGVSMEFVLIPPGSFQMGSETGEENEKPVHKVTLTKPFYLGKCEVTQEQWQAVMGTNPSATRGPGLPVTDVSWEDCQAFIGRLNEKPRAAGPARPGGGTEPVPPSSGFRLPTEAEWEYACRAGSTTAFSFGDAEASLGEYAWYFGNNEGKSHPVGQKKPNAWGLYDMHGNVWEWCQDWYADYAVDAATDPAGAATGSYRVRRSGSWPDDAGFCRSACRNRSTPGRRIPLGFRLVLAPPVRQ